MTIDADARARLGLRVKPLVWESISDRTQEAVGFNATYRVQTMQDGSARWNSRYMGVWYGAESPSDAQAAAQADYEARILAALTAHEAKEADNG